MIPSRRDHEVEVIAPRARTDAYATVEKYGLIWVCLGDDPDAASPIFDMPEWDDDAFRFTVNEEIWEADYHTAKFTNLDYVHLPVVHGILFQGNENPIQAPEHHITATDHGYQSIMRVNPAPSEGVWSELREKDTQVESIMKFFVPGLTLRGQVEIGGIGSGEFNIFYEFSTPIDEHRTMMRHYFLRNYMMEEDFDSEHTRRNLQNISPGQTTRRIATAESRGHRPEPERPLYPRRRQDHADLLGPHGEDAQQGLADRSIRTGRNAGPGGPDHPVTGSRKANPDGWVYEAMPRIAARKVAEHPVSELKFVDIDNIEPTRPKDYGKSEPLVPNGCQIKRDARVGSRRRWPGSTRRPGSCSR